MKLSGNSQEIFSLQFAYWRVVRAGRIPSKKQKPRTSVELGAQQLFMKASGVYTSSWTEASLNTLLLTASQGFIKAGSWELFCKIKVFGFRILQCWICLYPRMPLACLWFIGEVYRGFLTWGSQLSVRFFCFNEIKLPWF